MRVKNARILLFEWDAKESESAPALLLTIRLARISRSRTNHFNVNESTSGITPYAINANTSANGRTNRSERFMGHDSLLWPHNQILLSHVSVRTYRQLPDFRVGQRPRFHRLVVSAEAG